MASSAGFVNGLSVYRSLDVQTTGTVAKSAAGALYGGWVSNAAASVRYLKIYDKATAPTQADTPKLTLALPAGAVANILAAFGAATPDGITFSNGISVRATTGVADNDTGAPAANDVVANLFYH